MSVPAGQVQRGPAILATVVDIALERKQHSYHASVAVDGCTVNGIGASLNDEARTR